MQFQLLEAEPELRRIMIDIVNSHWPLDLFKALCKEFTYRYCSAAGFVSLQVPVLRGALGFRSQSPLCWSARELNLWIFDACS